MLEKLHSQIVVCVNCPLSETRRNAVPGEGNPESRIVIIGEAPGYWEDVQGKPFVGRSGKLLDKILSEFGFDRTKVFITNIVKCRPPENRQPNKLEKDKCSLYIQTQLELIKPRVLIPLGNTAGEWLFKKYNLEWPKMTKANGQIFEIEGENLIILPAFHPAAILRNPLRTDDFRAVFRKLRALSELIQ